MKNKDKIKLKDFKIKVERKKIKRKRNLTDRLFDIEDHVKRNVRGGGKIRTKKEIRLLRRKIKNKRRKVVGDALELTKTGLKIDENELIASICRDSFFEFVKEFWHCVVAEQPVWNWHIEYLCNELQVIAERVFKDEAKEYDLVTNIPPGTTKSTIMSVMYPAWIWTRMPSARFIGASHSDNLSLDLSIKCRDIIKSDKYRACYPEIQLREDQDTKTKFQNTKGGYRYAVGVSGSVIGMHAHFIVLDDPIDALKATSAAEIKKVNYWIDNQLSNRKVSKSVSVMILVMQRLHQEDPTTLFLKRKKIKHICLPAERSEKISPPELRKYYTKLGGRLLDPVRLTHENLAEEKRKGQYYYACTPGNTPILMANWKEKPMCDVKVGDVVVGFKSGMGTSKTNKSGKFSRATLQKAIVLDKQQLIGKVYKFTTASGREYYSTAKHEWWKRPREAKVRAYSWVKKVGKFKIYSVYDPICVSEKAQQRIYDWLGGMIDGEGACKFSQITIYQSSKVNSPIHKEIGRCLDRLGIKYKEYPNCYVLKGGRSMKIDLINNAKMVKRKQISKAMWNNCHYVAEREDRVIKKEYVGRMPVYGLTTTTGNYVAWGFASSNSQFMQDPVPLGGGMFKVKRVKPGRVPTSFKKVVRYWDKGGTAGGGAFTVGTKMGLDFDGRFWVLDVIRTQLDSFEREALMQRTAQADGKAVKIGLEQEPGSGGKESAESSVRRLAGYSVTVQRAAGTAAGGLGGKVERADPFSVQMNAGNVYIPDYFWNETIQDWKEGTWVLEWLDEHRYFPNSKYKDQVDSSSGAFSLCYSPVVRVGGMLKGGSGKGMARKDFLKLLPK